MTTGIFGRIKRFFSPARPAPPPVALDAQPVELNPPPSVSLTRHVARLVRLYDAHQAGGTPVLLHEIERRKGHIMAAGHPAPKNADEAKALLKKLRAS